MHQRLAPRRYALRHSLFMFYLDLDEIEPLARALRLFSRNRWNLYSFHDADHLPGSAAASRVRRCARGWRSTWQRRVSRCHPRRGSGC
jgi:uncharacterized protein